MKLINTPKYLLLVDDEEYYTNKDYITNGEHVWEYISNGTNSIKPNKNIKVIAYLPLSNESKELQLPILPIPTNTPVSFNPELNKQCAYYKSPYGGINKKIAHIFKTSDENLKDIEIIRPNEIIRNVSIERIVYPIKTDKVKGKEQAIGTYEY